MLQPQLHSLTHFTPLPEATMAPTPNGNGSSSGRAAADFDGTTFDLPTGMPYGPASQQLQHQQMLFSQQHAQGQGSQQGHHQQQQQDHSTSPWSTTATTPHMSGTGGGMDSQQNSGGDGTSSLDDFWKSMGGPGWDSMSE